LGVMRYDVNLSGRLDNKNVSAFWSPSFNSLKHRRDVNFVYLQIH
jgi:hypothetical protein